MSVVRLWVYQCCKGTTSKKLKGQDEKAKETRSKKLKGQDQQS